LEFSHGLYKICIRLEAAEIVASLDAEIRCVSAVNVRVWWVAERQVLSWDMGKLTFGFDTRYQ